MNCIFSNVALIDGTDGPILHEAFITVEDGVIKSIDSTYPRKAIADQIIDLSGKYIIPGIIDAHVHSMLDCTPQCVDNIVNRSIAENTIICLNNLKELMCDGVVFFREMGGQESIDTAVAAALREGIIEGPGMLPSVGVLTMTGGHCWMFSHECDSPEEIRKAVRNKVKNGAKFIKFMATGGIHTPGNRLSDTQFTLEELRMGVETAHQLGVHTAAHALSAKGIANAVNAGIDSLEHGCFMHEDPKIYETMKKNETYYVPTLIAICSISDASKDHHLNKSIIEKAMHCAENHKKSFRMALEYDLKIAFGTDRGTTMNHHGQGSRELVMMVDYGMKPMQAIVSASKTSSELLGISDLYGTLEIGKYANFIVLDQNPISDMRAILGKKDVYIKGIRYA